jgi:hypothetical protein
VTLGLDKVVIEILTWPNHQQFVSSATSVEHRAEKTAKVVTIEPSLLRELAPVAQVATL